VERLKDINLEHSESTSLMIFPPFVFENASSYVYFLKVENE